MLKVYFKYFEGRYIKHGNRVPSDAARYLKEYFIEEQFHKLSYSLDKLENYLLWVFSTHGKMSWQTAFSYIDEYLKVERKAFDISPFSAIISKYIREEGIHSWKEYLLPNGSSYPKIVQHYMRDKNFPFEFILYLNWNIRRNKRY